MRTHVDALTRQSGHDADERWIIEGALVTTVPLLIAYRDDLEVPILSCWDAVWLLMDPNKVGAHTREFLTPNRTVAWTQLGQTWETCSCGAL